MKTYVSQFAPLIGLIELSFELCQNILSEHTWDFHKICHICWLMSKSRTMSVCTITSSKITQIKSSFRESLQVIKRLFLSTTLKQIKSLLSACTQHLHAHRRPGKFIHMWRSCWFYFSTFMEFCITNVSQRQELWTNIFTHMFRSVCGEMWGHNAYRSGALETACLFTMAPPVFFWVWICLKLVWLLSHTLHHPHI